MAAIRGFWYERIFEKGENMRAAMHCILRKYKMAQQTDEAKA